jgi:hypothetical protein
MTPLEELKKLAAEMPHEGFTRCFHCQLGALIPRLEAEQVRLRELLSELYQVCGVLNAPAKVLDQIVAGTVGKPLPYETLLPFGNESAPAASGGAHETD